MRRFLLFVFILLFCLASASAEDTPWVVEEEQAISSRNQAQWLMRDMTLEEKVYQLFIVAPEALTGESRTTVFSDAQQMKARPVGGIVLYGQNIVSEEQLKQLTQALKDGAAESGIFAPFIAVDEEGGAVSRVANKLGYPLALSPEEIGLQDDPALAYAAGKEISAYLRPLGINLNFAPVADVSVENGPELIGRTYGMDAQRVSSFAQQMAQGLRDGQVIPCYKHFPGHGAVTGDTHISSASSRRTRAQMEMVEWLPFQDGIGMEIEMIMISHLIARGLEDEAPASLSSTVIDGVLRGELGFQGVVVTDALRMKSITRKYSASKAAVQAIQAGADLLLLPDDLDDAAKGIIQAVENGKITMERLDESVSRILALKIQSGIIQ